MEDSDKTEHYKRYGWTCSEANLATLPSTAPQAARDLAKWLTLEGRRSSLEEWLGHVQSDGRIHGKFWHIGSWTHRMSHSKPNQANIPSPFHGDPKSAVEEVKAKYDKHMRAHWQATPGRWLVGTDLDGAQLRVLAAITKSSKWTEALQAGDKKLGTDVHSLNKLALGSVCKDRDTAKTYVYGFLLGASIPKQAEILSCSIKDAKEANAKFLDSFPELKKLRSIIIPRDARRGYFVGLDGRKVKCDSEHHMLAGYLQNGEAVIAKHWTVLWRKMAKEAGLWFNQVDFVHDEVQVEVKSEEDGRKLIELQHKAIEAVSKDLNLFCPMAVEGKLGKNWADSH